MADFWCALTEVGPLMRRGVGKTIGHGTVRAVDDAGAARVLDSGNRLFSRVDGLGEEPRRTGLGLVTCGIAENLKLLHERCCAR